MRVRMMVVAVGAVLAAACTDAKTPTGVGPAQPLAQISDGDHSGGNPHFFFLPPLVPNPGPGTNLTGLSPVVKIFECPTDQTVLCVISSGDAPIATFTTTDVPGPGMSATIRAGDNHYIVDWHTQDVDLHANKTYRICVSVGDKTLGHADVDVVENGRDLKAHRTANADSLITLLDGRTLPIKFRVEVGATDETSDDGCPGGAPELAGIHGTVDTAGVHAQGWEISLFLADDPLNPPGPSTVPFMSTTTNPNGEYSFTGLTGTHTYWVCAQQPPPAVDPDLPFGETTPIVNLSPPPTTPICPNGTIGYELFVGPGDLIVGIDFQYFRGAV